MTQVTAEMWRMLKPEDKRPYEEIYRNERMKYDEEIAIYLKKYPHMKGNLIKKAKK